MAIWRGSAGAHLASGPLNVAEGSYSRGGNRTARYHTAAGSMREALSCWRSGMALGYLPDIDAGIRDRVRQGARHPGQSHRPLNKRGSRAVPGSRPAHRFTIFTSVPIT